MTSYNVIFDYGREAQDENKMTVDVAGTKTMWECTVQGKVDQPLVISVGYRPEDPESPPVLIENMRLHTETSALGFVRELWACALPSLCPSHGSVAWETGLTGQALRRSAATPTAVYFAVAFKVVLRPTVRNADGLSLKTAQALGLSREEFFARMESTFKSAQFSDVVIAHAGDEYKLHRTVLSTGSTHFRDLLAVRVGTKEAPLDAGFPGIPRTAFQRLLWYVYCSKLGDPAPACPEEWYDVYRAAAIARIPDLRRVCLAALGECIDEEFVCAMLNEHHDRFGTADIDDLCLKFLCTYHLTPRLRASLSENPGMHLRLLQHYIREAETPAHVLLQQRAHEVEAEAPPAAKRTKHVDVDADDVS